MNTPSAPVSAGAKLRAAIAAEKPLQVVGAINAYAARMAEATGFRALYLSGGGVAANSLGLPDLGISTLTLALQVKAAVALAGTQDVGLYLAAGAVRHVVEACAAARDRFVTSSCRRE